MFQQSLQSCSATTSDVEHRPAVLNIDVFQTPVRQWRMTEVHKLQHGASHPSLRTGTVSEKSLY